jgi:hypothetical protein
MYSYFILYRFQYMTRAPFDTTPASGTIIFNDADNFVSVLLPAMHAEKNP